MSWPTTTFRSELPPVMRKELDALSAVLRGNLSSQHNSAGGHTNVTAETVAISDELRIGQEPQRLREGSNGGLGVYLKGSRESVVLYDAAGNALVDVGKVNPGSGGVRPGISFAPFAPGIGEAWALAPHADSFDQGFAITDVSNANPVVVLYRNGSTTYALCPAANGLATLTDLGQPSPSRLRWSNVYATNLIASDRIVQGGRGLGEWQAFTPVLRSSGDPQPANYAAIGRYAVTGKTCSFWANLAFDATTVFGSGVWGFDLPLPINGAVTGANAVLGLAMIYDVSTEFRTASLVFDGASRALAVADHSANYIGPTLPMVWAAGDGFRYGGTYELA